MLNFLRKMIPVTNPPDEAEALIAEQGLLNQTNEMKRGHTVRLETQRQIDEEKQRILDNGRDKL